MRLTAILLLALLPVLADAGAIYRHTDARGNVIYTDQPPEGAGATEVELPPLNTVSGGVVSGAAPEGEKPAPVTESTTFAGYSSLEIRGVSNGDLLQNPEGGLSFSAVPSPGLQEGDKILLTFDGKQVSDTGSCTLPILDRGAHTVGAEIVGPDGKSLLKAADVSFDVQKHFIKQPTAKPKKPKAK